MTKLEYQMSAEDIKTLDTIRLKGNPALAIITLETKKCTASITTQVPKDAIPAESNALTEFKNLAFSASDYQNEPCIVVFTFDTTNKISGAERQVIGCCKWVPDTCSAMKRMVYTSAWNSIKTELTKAHFNSNNMFEISDWDDMEDKIERL